MGPVALALDLRLALENGAGAADATAAWPDASWAALRAAGALRWSIAKLHGGDGLAGPELLERYEALASACLTTCFILSQREAACRRIQDSGNDRLCGELLPALAAGERFATVGLSQLTTSRQHGRPSLSGKVTDAALLLDGTVPWVTGAPRADHFVIGAVLDDGRQVLAAVPKETPALSVGPPLALMALEGSLTAEIRCANLVLDRKWILAGPVERVMAGARGGTGGLETSCLALGLSRAAVGFLREEAATRSELLPHAEKLELACGKTRAAMFRLAREGSTPETSAALRTKANALALRATQAALTAAKGTGFLRDHPAQRWARQALFFLVWSCPGPVARATLDSMSCDIWPE